MSGPVAAGLAILAGYLLGSVPVGLLVGRLVGGVDLRDFGSRRTGATNATRTLGARWGALVLLLDLAKGVAAVLLARALCDGDTEEWVAAGAGLAAVAGHNWSVFIRFSGGRGVATTGGGLLALSPLAVAAVAALVTGALALTGIGSWPAFGYALLAGTLVFASHGDNIGRLRAGTERRIGEREALSSDDRT